MITVIGGIERRGFGTGAWALVAEDGATYELLDCPRDLRKVGLKVKVQGTLNDDVMTLAMIGKVLNVSSFEILENRSSVD
ncbi:MAG: hypothetical protein RLZZ135_1337 [Cyanobacteriota bacterium]|jgi:hypothetical protein